MQTSRQRAILRAPLREKLAARGVRLRIWVPKKSIGRRSRPVRTAEEADGRSTEEIGARQETQAEAGTASV